jgi:carbamoyl-phosphate synthase large subunit
MIARRSKVFITGAGGSGSIAVIQSLRELGYEVIAGDASPHAAGLGIADRGYVVPFGAEPAFETTIRELIATERPEFVIPTVDEEIPVVHRLVAREFPETRVLTPRLAFCEAMLDKWRMHDVLASARIDVARTWLANDAAGAIYPAVVKPRVGRGSRGVAYLEGPADLARYLASAPAPADRYIVQTRAFGVEYTTSAVVGLDNSMLAVVPKQVVQKIGITQVGITRVVPRIDAQCRAIRDALEPHGPFNVQGVLTDDGTPIVFEINPRYSTTVALTLAAGVNEVDEVIRRALGEPPISLAFEPDLVMIRYAAQLYVKERDWKPRELRRPPR